MQLLGSLRLEVVIEQDHGGKRKGVGRKERDLLLDAIFEDAELIFAKIVDEIATVRLSPSRAPQPAPRCCESLREDRTAVLAPGAVAGHRCRADLHGVREAIG